MFATSRSLLCIDRQPCKVWPGQEPAPGARGNWYLAPATLQGSAIYHINCNDKQKVYRVRSAAPLHIHSACLHRDSDSYRETEAATD
eukprot:2976181-Rhodomonas_salina.2